MTESCHALKINPRPSAGCGGGEQVAQLRAQVGFDRIDLCGSDRHGVAEVVGHDRIGRCEVCPPPADAHPGASRKLRRRMHARCRNGLLPRCCRVRPAFAGPRLSRGRLRATVLGSGNDESVRPIGRGEPAAGIGNAAYPAVRTGRAPRVTESQPDRAIGPGRCRFRRGWLGRSGCEDPGATILSS